MHITHTTETLLCMAGHRYRFRWAGDCVCDVCVRDLLHINSCQANNPSTHIHYSFWHFSKLRTNKLSVRQTDIV